MWTISKVFTEFVTILLLYVLVFGHETCGILATRPGIEPAPPALEGEVLTTGLPGKSLYFLITYSIRIIGSVTFQTQLDGILFFFNEISPFSILSSLFLQLCPILVLIIFFPLLYQLAFAA